MNFLLSSVVLISVVVSSHGFVIVPSTRAITRSGTPTALNGILGRFRKKKPPLEIKPIDIGASIPQVDVEMITMSNGEGDESEVICIPMEANKVLGSEGKSILIGMPGAFTPTCTSEHLPGIIDASPQLRNLGVNTIAVVTTNDKYVNEEWARNAGLLVENKPNPITVLADGDGELVKQLGLAEDMGFGVGYRAKRFALICEDGVVSQVLTDDGMDSCELTSAKNLIEILTPPKVEEVGFQMDEKTMTMIGGGVALALLALFVLASGGEDHTATVAPAVKAVVPALKSGTTDYSLLQQFGS